MDITHFTSPMVAAYIQEKGLYKIENADKALALERERKLAEEGAE